MTADHAAARHDPIVTEYAVPVKRARNGRVRAYRTARVVECSCGQPLGVGLDYIDARRVWRNHR